MAQRRLSEAEMEMDRKSWENFRDDFYETNRQLESQRTELYRATQWASQAQMEN